MAAILAGNTAHANPAVPVVVFCDFDGTVTLEDTLVLLLDRFGRPRADGTGWRSIEDDPDLPEIRKLQAEMDLLRITWPRALEYLHTVVRLREGFRQFHDLLVARGIPLRLVSGGFVEIIEAFLPRAEFPGVEVLANRVRITDGRWVVLPADRPRIPVPRWFTSATAPPISVRQTRCLWCSPGTAWPATWEGQARPGSPTRPFTTSPHT
jgi:hypothetical protein